jgi:sugar O-acyltransferase (sialic acid O-acetyltransferase NeuD family)
MKKRQKRFKKIWIYGTSEDSGIILDSLFLKGEKADGFIDDDSDKKEFLGLPVRKLEMFDLTESIMIIGISDNHARKTFVNKTNFQITTLIHPSASVSASSILGKGCVILSQSVINSDSRIGEHCLINNANIDQNCKIGDFVNIGPGSRISRNVTIGSLTNIGARTTICENINIGTNTNIGAGSVVVKDIPDNYVVTGDYDRSVKPQIKKYKTGVYIIGASGYGREIESWVSQSQNFNDNYIIKGFLDDNPKVLDGYPSDYKIIGKIDNFKFKKEDFVLLGISDPAIKEKIVNLLRDKVRFLSFVSEKSIIDKNVLIGEGTIIAPGCSVSPNVTVGRYVSVIVGTIIGHDSGIDDFSSIMANVIISGNTKIGNNVLIGSGSTIVPGKTVGNNSKISAGSVLFTNVKANSTVYGNPARSIPKIKTKQE